MTRKFNDDKFIETFIKNFDQDMKEQRRPPIIVSLTRVAVQTCRELRYAMNKNRDQMRKLIKEWWDNQPKRDDGRHGKKINGKNCHLSSAWGPTFISIAKFSGCNSGDLISFW